MYPEQSNDTFIPPPAAVILPKLKKLLVVSQKFTSFDLFAYEFEPTMLKAPAQSIQYGKTTEQAHILTRYNLQKLHGLTIS